MNSILKFVLVVSLVVISIAAWTGWDAFGKAREENTALLAGMQAVKVDGIAHASGRPTDSEEVSRLRRENSEILQLRNEVGQLRSESAM